jgi:hypothetical protein
MGLLENAIAIPVCSESLDELTAATPEREKRIVPILRRHDTVVPRRLRVPHAAATAPKSSCGTVVRISHRHSRGPINDERWPAG